MGSCTYFEEEVLLGGNIVKEAEEGTLTVFRTSAYDPNIAIRIENFDPDNEKLHYLDMVVTKKQAKKVIEAMEEILSYYREWPDDMKFTDPNRYKE